MFDQHITNKINDYYSFCKAKSYAHLKAAEMYKRLYNYTTAPVIVLSSITTLLASYNINTTLQSLIILTAVASGIVTISHALASFLEYNVKHNTHLKTSNSYMTLVLNIENDFLIEYYNNDNNLSKEFVTSFFEKIHNLLKNIKNNEPCLPSSIANQNYINNYYGLNDIDEQLIFISSGQPPRQDPISVISIK